MECLKGREEEEEFALTFVIRGSRVVNILRSSFSSILPEPSSSNTVVVNNKKTERKEAHMEKIGDGFLRWNASFSF